MIDSLTNFTDTNPPLEHYVYAYLREDGSPYYIGKGKGKRAWTKDKKKVSLPKDETRIQLVENHLSEKDALDLEIKLIAQYGRKDLGTGILRNRTNGGEGISGHKHTEETKLKMSKSNKGKHYWIATEETKLKMRASKLNQSEETRNKLRLAKLGKKRDLSPETRYKLSEAGKKRWSNRSG